MNTAKKLFNWYINSSIHVALAVISLTMITVVSYELRLNLNLLLFIFFGSVAGYNFVKYAGVAGLHHRNLAKGLKIIQIITYFSIAGLLICAFFLPVEVLLVAGLFGVLTLLYALPLFRRRGNLRSVSGVKIFIIAFVWAGVTVVLPITAAENDLFGTAVIEFLQRFLLVLAWILPFEIRDLKYDLEQLGTIPQRIGVTRTKILGLIILIIVMGLEVIEKMSTLESLIAVICMVTLTAILMWNSKENQSRYFAAFWVEGIPILWLLLLLLLRSL